MAVFAEVTIKRISVLTFLATFSVIIGTTNSPVKNILYCTYEHTLFLMYFSKHTDVIFLLFSIQNEMLMLMHVMKSFGTCLLFRMYFDEWPQFKNNIKPVCNIYQLAYFWYSTVIFFQPIQPCGKQTPVHTCACICVNAWTCWKFDCGTVDANYEFLRTRCY